MPVPRKVASMKRRNQISPSIGIAFCTLQAQGDNALQLFPAGQFTAPRGAMAGSGPWTLNNADAASLISLAKQRQNDIVIDYEHQTLKAAENGQPAPAAGWLSPQDIHFVPGKGLLASNPKWTSKAAAHISNDEYRYLSPVFSYDIKTGRVLDLINVALTNQPAIDGMDKIMLAAASFSMQPQQEDAPMNEELLKLLGLTKDASEEDAVAALTSIVTEVDGLVAVIGVKDVTGLAALSAIKTELTDLIKAAEGAEQAIAAAKSETPGTAMTVIKEQGEQIAALTARIDGDEMNTLIAAAKAEGKLVPAQEDWARSLGVDKFKDFIKAAPRIAALSQTQTHGKEQEFDKDGKAILNDEQLAICSQLGLSADEFAAGLAQEK